MRAILTYHSVDASGSVISTAPDRFRAQIEWLAASGVEVLSVEDLLAAPGDADAVAITFDDGFVNFATRAWPVLAEHAMPVTLFVVADHAGGRNDWDPAGDEVPSLPLLDWEELGRLAEEGVEIGSHGCGHARLPQLSPEARRHELARSARAIATHLGFEPGGFAYPFGAYDIDVVEAAQEHYDWAVTADLRLLDLDTPRHRLPRVDAYYLREPGTLESWGTSRFRRRVWLRRQGRRVRRGVSRAAGGRR